MKPVVLKGHELNNRLSEAFHLDLHGLDQFFLGRFRMLRTEEGLLTEPRRNRLAFVALFFVLLGAVGIAAGIEGRFSSEDWPGIIFDDWRRLFRVNDDELGSSPPDFPLTRDSASILVLVLQVANLYLIHWQWEHISTFGSRLVDGGVVRPASVLTKRDNKRSVKSKTKGSAEEQNVELIHSSFGSANGVYSKGAPGGIILFILILLATQFFYRGLESSSIFEGFASSNLQASELEAWRDLAYRSWWASEENTPGSFAFIGVASLVIYYIALQNVVGIQVAYLYVRNCRRFELDVDLRNLDGAYGWAPLRQLMNTVYWSLFVNSLSLTLVLVVLQGNSVGGLQPILVVIAIAGPLFPLTPLVLVKSGLRPAIQRRRAELIETVGCFESTRPPGELELEREALYRSQADAISNASRYPARTLLWSVLLVQFVPLAVAVLQLSVWVR